MRLLKIQGDLVMKFSGFLLLVAALPLFALGCSTRESPADSSAVRAQLFEARALAQQDDYAGAIDRIDSLERAARSDPELHAQVLREKAIILSGFDKKEEAIEVLRGCIEAHPDTPTGLFCRLLLPEMLKEMGRPEEAIKEYDQLLKEWRAQERYDDLFEEVLVDRALLAEDQAAWLRSQMETDDLNLKRISLKVLAELPGVIPAQEVRPFLSDRDPRMRIAAAQILWDHVNAEEKQSLISPMLQLADSTLQTEQIVPYPNPGVLQELIGFLAETHDPRAQLKIIEILYKEPLDFIANPVLSESLHNLDPWTIAYLLPLLDDKRETGGSARLSGWSADARLRVCDQAARAINAILPYRLPSFEDSGRQIGARDAKIKEIRQTWEEIASNYPIPPEAQEMAEKLGTYPLNR